MANAIPGSTPLMRKAPDSAIDGQIHKLRRPRSSLYWAAAVDAIAAPVRAALSSSFICRRLLPRRPRSLFHWAAAVEAAAAPERTALSPSFICRRLLPRRPRPRSTNAVEVAAAPVHAALSPSFFCRQLLVSVCFRVP